MNDLRAAVEDADRRGRLGHDYGSAIEAVLALIDAHQCSALDVERLAEALSLELHIDQAHGFPPGFTSADLAAAIIARLRSQP